MANRVSGSDEGVMDEGVMDGASRRKSRVRKVVGGHDFGATAGSPFGTTNVWPGKIRFGSRI